MDFDFASQIAAKSDKELMDIYVNGGQFQERFVALAEAELEKRNVPLDHLRQIRTEKQKVSEDALFIGKQGSPLFIGFSFLVAFLGGIPGLIAGYIYNQSKQTNRNGDRYYTYNESTRKMGAYIMAVGFTVLMISLFLRLK
jgi:hypothetical protein